MREVAVATNLNFAEHTLNIKFCRLLADMHLKIVERRDLLRAFRIPVTVQNTLQCPDYKVLIYYFRSRHYRQLWSSFSLYEPTKKVPGFCFVNWIECAGVPCYPTQSR